MPVPPNVRRPTLRHGVLSTLFMTVTLLSMTTKAFASSAGPLPPTPATSMATPQQNVLVPRLGDILQEDPVDR